MPGVNRKRWGEQTSGWVVGHCVGAHLHAVGGAAAATTAAEIEINGRNAARTWRSFMMLMGGNL